MGVERERAEPRAGKTGERWVKEDEPGVTEVRMVGVSFLWLRLSSLYIHHSPHRLCPPFGRTTGGTKCNGVRPVPTVLFFFIIVFSLGTVGSPGEGKDDPRPERKETDGTKDPT